MLGVGCAAAVAAHEDLAAPAIGGKQQFERSIDIGPAPLEFRISCVKIRKDQIRFFHRGNYTLSIKRMTSEIPAPDSGRGNHSPSGT
jgi:predicted ATPase